MLPPRHKIAYLSFIFIDPKYIIQIAQPIKLYPPGTPANTIPTDTETPVVAETYDEVVFTNPTETFFQQLQSIAHAPSIEYSQEDHFLKYSDTDDIKALLEAQKFLHTELEWAKQRLLQVDTDLVRVDEALRQQEEIRKKAAAANAAKASASGTRKASAARSATSTGPATKKAKSSSKAAASTASSSG